VAGDTTRGDTEDAWNTASILFDSVTDIELCDPDLPSSVLLFRLFNEQGVRMETPRRLEDKCTCSEEKLLQMLKGMPPAEVKTLAEDDGAVSADCQFCGRIYRFPVESVLGGT